MKPLLIVYATREGQTRRIAEHLAAEVRTRGRTAEVVGARDVRSSLELTKYSAVVVAASVHAGKHEREMLAFVRAHREGLERMPTAFLSVSLAESGAEDTGASPDVRDRSRQEVQEAIDTFFQETGWHPGRVKPVAGALLYTKYNFIIRFVMKQIAKKKGATTDTSRDHEYTDWAALDRFVEELLHDVPAVQGGATANLV
jgi:menaquinone-dependent protoporphyrinogen oxidase